MADEYKVRIAKSVALKCAIEICKTIKNMSQDTAEVVVDYFTDKYYAYLSNPEAIALSVSEEPAEF
jgi:hypothetical protein